LGIEGFDQPREVGERTGQPVYLIDDDHIDPAGSYFLEKPGKRGAVHRSSRIAAVVIAVSEQGPALVELALDVGFASFSLGIEAVEVLIQTLVGGFPRVDGAAKSLLCHR
jgi:hypothetical protein